MFEMLIGVFVDCNLYLSDSGKSSGFNYGIPNNGKNFVLRDRFLPNVNAKSRYSVLSLDKPENQYQDMLFKSLFGAVGQSNSILFDSNKNVSENKENQYKKVHNTPSPFMELDIREYLHPYNNTSPLSFVNQDKLAVVLENECYLMDLNSSLFSKLTSIKTTDDINSIWCDESQKKIVGSCFHEISFENRKFSSMVFINDAEVDKLISKRKVELCNRIDQIKLEKNIMSYRDDGKYIFQDIRTKDVGKEISIFKESDVISCFERSPDGSAIAFGSLFGLVKVYDDRMMNGNCVKMYLGASEINDIKWHPTSSRQIAVASSTSCISLLYSGLGQFTEAKKIHTTVSVKSMLWPLNNYLISGQSNGKFVEGSGENENYVEAMNESSIKIWDINSCQQVGEYLSSGGSPKTQLLGSLENESFVCLEKYLSFYKMPKDLTKSVVVKKVPENKRFHGIR